MDILSLVKSDQLYSYELRHPITEEPLGIVLKLRSANSDEVKAVSRKHSDTNLLRMQKGKSTKSAVLESQAEERAAAMIADWEWNSDMGLGDQSNPACDHKNKLLLVGNDFFFDQIIEASSAPANFTKTPE